MKEYYFYERGDWLINHEINKTFEEVLWMSDDEFTEWVKDVREAVVYAWDVLGNPPVIGKNEEEIIEQFEKLKSFDPKDLELTCDLTGDQLLRVTTYYGNAVNQWFPTMMKTRISYSETCESYSIYDHFAKPELFEKARRYMHRNLKRDSFYSYSVVVKAKDIKESLFHSTSAVDWIRKFEEKYRCYDTHDYWIEPVDKSNIEYSGYSNSVKKYSVLSLTKDEVGSLKDIVPEKCLTNIECRDSDTYRIRIFEKGHKVFPSGYKAFRVSWCQYAVNYPPLLSKYIYEQYTNKTIEEDRKFYVWDPSAGWAGRLLGCMSVEPRFGIDEDGYSVPCTKIHYIGTDPNTDHNTPDGKTKYHNVADFYNDVVNQTNLLINDADKNTYEIYQCGSEVVQHNEEFMKYKGKLDLVFTSPPYFNKEIYSEDKNQSALKYSNYDAWRDGFLYETLKTAWEWLRDGGHLVWNIADIKLGSSMMPLEKDSIDIIEGLGFEHVRNHKMVMSQMPGGNRVDQETGLPKCKNYCQIDGKWFKFEYIFVFKKPNKIK